MNQPEFLARKDVSYLDRVLFDDSKRLRQVPSSLLEKLDYQDLRIWCHLNGVYALVTNELVDWLAEFINGRTAIEIGSGNGALGRALRVPKTDSYIQRRTDVMLMYMMSGQPLVQYGEDVERLEALEAVSRYTPQVVFGAWVTHWIDPYLPAPPGGGSMYGVRELELLAQPSVEAYVVVGNKQIHGYKPICSISHQVHQFPWLWSRSGSPEDNAIFVWQGKDLFNARAETRDIEE